MNENLLAFCSELEESIRSAYESSLTVLEAEKLAAKFLAGSLKITNELEKCDLDRRMRKAGVKAIRAAVYLDHINRSEKKPSDTLLGALVDSDTIVNQQQNDLDVADVLVDKLKNYLSIFHEAHVFCRGISKGAYNG